MQVLLILVKVIVFYSVIVEMSKARCVFIENEKRKKPANVLSAFTRGGMLLRLMR